MESSWIREQTLSLALTDRSGFSLKWPDDNFSGTTFHRFIRHVDTPFWWNSSSNHPSLHFSTKLAFLFHWLLALFLSPLESHLLDGDVANVYSHYCFAFSMVSWYKGLWILMHSNLFLCLVTCENLGKLVRKIFSENINSYTFPRTSFFFIILYYSFLIFFTQ